ncbi:precocious dissociation of sister chromatids [Scheffersomyces xylosifermentans]|uniref:precocious dissociation of sister chromatids n=1 Tax=Scheffersomyces xylosifermentans TaxID=1304137 RepID=UPI00315CEC5A
MTRSASRSNKPKLSFKKSIIPSVKESISTKELLVRLQALSDEFSSLDQDNYDVEAVKRYQVDLINKKLLQHANAGVQAYTCCALSDILRITAPNAPFTAQQLSELFRAFLRQFKRLSDQENPYFHQQSHILKRLAEVRSIILITDLPDADQLIEATFDTFYSLAAKDFPSKLEPLASDILAETISEAENIPTNVLKLILNKFIRNSNDSSTSEGGIRTIKSITTNPAYNFSLHICETNLDRMSRQVAQYFSEMLYDSSNQVEMKPTSSTVKEREKYSTALDNLNKIHNLSIQIWTSIPELLGSVMGLIDDELNADDEKIRILATATIGQMIGSNNYSSPTTGITSMPVSKVNFIITHRETWANWLKKTSDISPLVRAKWVEQLPAIVNSPNSSTTEVSNALGSCLHKCLLDTDERVRATACRSIERVSFENFTNRLCNKNIMLTLSHLAREKNPKIRNLAISIFGSLYDNYEQIELKNGVINFGSHNEKESAELQTLISESIPNQILSLMYINDTSINHAVDLILFEKLLPASETNAVKRVERMTKFYKSLDAKGKQSFIAINKRQQQVSKVVQTFVETAEEYNRLTSNTEDKENINDSKSEERSKLTVKLERIIKWICVSFPDGLNTYSCLERFYKLNRARFFYLLKLCVSPDSDYNTVRNSTKELLTKLSDSKNTRLEGDRSLVSSSDIVANFKLLLMRSSLLFFNKSNVPELINYSRDPSHSLHITANEILEQISGTVPDVFKFHISALTDLITEDESNSNAPRAHNLRTIYQFIKKFPVVYPKDLAFSEALKKIAINGTPREARYATKILGLSNKRELYASEIVNAVYPLDLESKNFATHLSVIAELFIVDPLSIQEKASDLTSMLIKEIFLKNRGINEDEVKSEGEWIDDETLDAKFKEHSTLYEKLLALRLLVNRLKGLEKGDDLLSTSEKQDIMSNAQPVLKLLMSFIGNGGEIINKNSPTWPTPEVYKSKLRLTAGLYLLKLAKYPIYSEMIFSTTLRRLTFLLTDSSYNVRASFLNSLQKKLADELISERFLPIIFFTALEPSIELKNNSIMWIKSLYRRQEAKESIKFEKALVRIIHTLAHHEQYILLLYDGEEKDRGPNDKGFINAYTYALKFITYYISLIAKSENISLLYYFASRIKQHRDATIDSDLYEASELPESVLNIYRMSELAQLIIKEYADHKNWPMQTWPGKLKLPSDIYSQMTSVAEVQNVITKVFIPDKIQVELKGPIRKRLFGAGSKRKGVFDSEVQSKRVKPATKPKNSNKAKPKPAKKKSEPTRKSSRSTQKVDYMVDESESDSEESFDDDEDSDF